MAPGRSLYAKLMVPYFGMYAVTMMYNPTKCVPPSRRLLSATSLREFSLVTTR